MKDLIENNEMTEKGLKYFNMSLINDLNKIIENSNQFNNIPAEITMFFKETLDKEHSLELLLKEHNLSKKDI